MEDKLKYLISAVIFVFLSTSSLVAATVTGTAELPTNSKVEDSSSWTVGSCGDTSRCGTPLESTITIDSATTGEVTAVKVSINPDNLNHRYFRREICITLSHEGKTAILKQVGGEFYPSTADFNGTAQSGDWTVAISDCSTLNYGELNSWEILIDYDITSRCGTAEEACASGELISCTSIPGGNYTSGKAACREDCTGYDESACGICGNGFTDPEEFCDGGKISCDKEGEWRPDRIHTGIWEGLRGYALCKPDCSGYGYNSCESLPRNKVMAIKHTSYTAKTTPDSLPTEKVSAQDIIDLSEEYTYDPEESKKELAKHYKGWFTNLPPYTRLVGSPVFLKGHLYFTTYTTVFKNDSQNICEMKTGLGWSYLWEVNAYNGQAVRANPKFKDDRLRNYLGQGLASAPIIVGDKLVIGTTGEIGKDYPLHGDTPVDSFAPGATIIKPFCDDGSLPPCNKKSFKILWWKTY